VKVALDAPACSVRSLDDPRSRRSQLLARIRVRERCGDELGEAADPLLGARWKGARQLAGCHDRGYVDRSSDDRADPEHAQLRRQLALDAGVVVHPLGAPAAVELRGDRLAVDRMRSPTGKDGLPLAAHEPTTVATRSSS